MSGDHNEYQKTKSYLDDFECPRCGHCCQALVDANDTSQERVDETAKRKHIKTWNERCEEHPDHQERIISERMIQARMQEEIDELRQALVDDGGNCYGDGTVYRGQRSKDSAVQTLRLRTRARGEKLT
jgi:hypothetical protein